VPNTVLEAIKLGLWDFEPREMESEEFEACGAMPGTADKLTALAERVRLGLPLWHPADRNDCEEPLPGPLACEAHCEAEVTKPAKSRKRRGRRAAASKRARRSRRKLVGSPH
jgi:hypothetical protein